MDMISLRWLDVAGATLNFRAAASRVFLSPAAFSDRIQRLEAELGAALFERTTRQMELTEIGRRLLPLARELLEAEARLKAVVREPRGRRTPTFVAVLPKYFVRDDLKANRLVRLLPRVSLRSGSFRWCGGAITPEGTRC